MSLDPLLPTPSNNGRDKISQQTAALLNWHREAEVFGLCWRFRVTERWLQARWDITWNKAGFTSQKEVHSMILLENRVQGPLG